MWGGLHKLTGHDCERRYIVGGDVPAPIAADKYRHVGEDVGKFLPRLRCYPTGFPQFLRKAYGVHDAPEQFFCLPASAPAALFVSERLLERGKLDAATQKLAEELQSRLLLCILSIFSASLHQIR